MPEFIDFLSVFGKQTRPRHFHFGAFKQRTRLSSSADLSSDHGLQIDQLGWSGRNLQLCYNLKSIEASSQGDWPWSPRDCILNHTFDIENIKTTWIIIKGNKLIQDRVRSAGKYQSPAALSSFETLDRAFVSTFATHLLVCDWAVENWEHYISYIEVRHHDISRRVVSSEINIPPKFLKASGNDPNPSTKRTGLSTSTKSARFGLLKSRTDTLQSWFSLPNKDTVSAFHSGVNPEHEVKYRSSFPNNGTMKVHFDTQGQDGFFFSDLQALHDLHDKAKEAILILQLNVKIMTQLVEFYRTTLRLEKFPKDLVQNSAEGFDFFQTRMEELKDDLCTYILKLETLVDYNNGCEMLLRGLLDFQNKEYNELVTNQSNVSTLNMENMATEMNEIALKTKTETVSMKVITLVTLFFLPGTFISTLMSTDIFQNHDNNPNAPNPYRNLGPLPLYLAISLPLTAVTLLIWAFFHLRERRRATIDKAKYANSRWQA
ncbi:hypothetical protein ACLMJK_004026 [Lecanora helva]